MVPNFEKEMIPECTPLPTIPSTTNVSSKKCQPPPTNFYDGVVQQQNIQVGLGGLQ